MFEEIDNWKYDIGIKNYAISETTLEEVFLKVGESRYDN